MSRFHFWQQWLYYSSLLFAAFGIMFAIYGNHPFIRLYSDRLATVFWDLDHLPVQADRFRAHIWASFGGTITCCYILLAFIAYVPFRKREKWAFWAIAIAFGVWIIIDSVACIYYAVYFQVYLINLFSMLVKALPLFFTWKYFFRREKSHETLEDHQSQKKSLL